MTRCGGALGRWTSSGLGMAGDTPHHGHEDAGTRRAANSLEMTRAGSSRQCCAGSQASGIIAEGAQSVLAVMCAFSGSSVVTAQSNGVRLDIMPRPTMTPGI